MLKYKQIDGMDSLSKLAIVDMSLSEDERIVTLARADGETFTFRCRGAQGEKGEPGDKGATGPRGESAFEIAERLALTTSINSTVWLATLKGDKGAPGTDGVDGPVGDHGTDGTVPEFQIGTTSWLAAGNDANLSLTKSGITYKLNFSIPNGENGANGISGAMPTLSMGNVTFGIIDGEEANASLTQTGHNYKLNVMIPKGNRGFNPAAESGASAYAPQINFIVNYIDNTMEPSVSYEDSEHVRGEDWVRTVTLNIPKGETGNRGATGAIGSDASVYHANYYFTGISDFQDILNSPSGLMGCAFDISSMSRGFNGLPVSRSYGDSQSGWSWYSGFTWRDSNGSFQYLLETNNANDDTAVRGYRVRGYNNSHTWGDTSLEIRRFRTFGYTTS